MEIYDKPVSGVVRFIVYHFNKINKGGNGYGKGKDIIEEVFYYWCNSVCWYVGGVWNIYLFDIVWEFKGVIVCGFDDKCVVYDWDVLFVDE